MQRQRPREKLPRPASEDGGELQTKFPGAFLGNSLTQRASNHCADRARFLEGSIMEETLKQVLMRRDGMTSREANEAIADARERVLEGEDPEEVLAEEFGLEPDYIFDLLG